MGGNHYFESNGSDPPILDVKFICLEVVKKRLKVTFRASVPMVKRVVSRKTHTLQAPFLQHLQIDCVQSILDANSYVSKLSTKRLKFTF